MALCSKSWERSIESESIRYRSYVPCELHARPFHVLSHTLTLPEK